MNREVEEIVLKTNRTRVLLLILFVFFIMLFIVYAISITVHDSVIEQVIFYIVFVGLFVSISIYMVELIIIFYRGEIIMIKGDSVQYVNCVVKNSFISEFDLEKKEKPNSYFKVYVRGSLIDGVPVINGKDPEGFYKRFREVKDLKVAN